VHDAGGICETDGAQEGDNPMSIFLNQPHDLSPQRSQVVWYSPRPGLIVVEIAPLPGSAMARASLLILTREGPGLLANFTGDISDKNYNFVNGS
jgi:hypothetical protein